ncbi:MAG: hypothetical protein J0L92_22530 [Deltaproteobacteria bacterium]|nr:hypothetical protein [Deltaproteobacteria bacterium]
MSAALAALLFATPVFGLALEPPSIDAALMAAPIGVYASVDPEIVAQASAAADAVDEADEDRLYTEQVRQRRELGQIHRALGIATWVSMTATVVLGFIQFYNLYGFGAGQDTNPCAAGSAVFGQEQCYGNPWPHRISAITTSALYTATFALSFAMPDPNHAAEGNGAFADHLRIHQILRWVHLAGMLAQVGIGIALSSGAFGDRANDYSTLQTVGAVHQVIGWTTWGALTAAGAIMLF